MEYESSEFQPVWQIVNALRSHDDALGEEIDAISRGLGRTGTVERRPGKLVLDLPRRIDFERFSNAFNARLITFTGSSFALGLGALEEFVEQYGHARVAQAHVTETGFRLGSWCGSRRQERRRGKLAAERVAALDALGFLWDPLSDDWQQGLTALEEFVRSHGHARVPRSYATETGRRLGSWCDNRRQERKHAKLATERIGALDALGFVWDPLEDDWQQGLNALEAFVRRHGHARVPRSYATEIGRRLGRWCSHQRLKRSRGELAAERIAALDALGFVWDPRQKSARLA